MTWVAVVDGIEGAAEDSNHGGMLSPSLPPPQAGEGCSLGRVGVGANRLSWKQLAEAFRNSWDHVFNSVEMAVTWGRTHQDLSWKQLTNFSDKAAKGCICFLYAEPPINSGRRRLLQGNQALVQKIAFRPDCRC